jgi:hypothetical protein
MRAWCVRRRHAGWSAGHGLRRYLRNTMNLLFLQVWLEAGVRNEPLQVRLFRRGIGRYLCEYCLPGYSMVGVLHKNIL